MARSFLPSLHATEQLACRGQPVRRYDAMCPARFPLTKKGRTASSKTDPFSNFAGRGDKTDSRLRRSALRAALRASVGG